MNNNFYAQWFSRTPAEPPTPQELLERETAYLRNLATSEFGEHCINHFDIPEVQEAENAFAAALMEVADPELRNKIDMAAGKISRAYQILGFCAGHFSQNSRSRAAFF